MKGHKHIEALENDVKQALKTGAKIDLIKQVYKFSFMMFDVSDPNELISIQLLELAKEQQPISFEMTSTKAAFSTNEMDYGSELPQFTWDGLSDYEKTFATDSKK